MGLVRVTAPATTPVTLAEAKKHCRAEDFTDDDVLLTLYIEAATAYLDGEEGILGKALVNQVWDLFWDEFPDGPIELPLPPLSSVNFVKYFDSGNVLTTLDPNEYAVDIRSGVGYVVPSVDGWPASYADTINAVNVRYVAGYGTAENVPAALKAAILLMVGDLYATRETVVVGQAIAESRTTELLLRPYRRMFV